MVLRYEARALVNQCRAPEGFHLQVKGKKPVPVEVEYVFLPSEPVHTFDYTPADLTVFDMIPRLKKVDFLGGSTSSPTEESPVTELAEVPGDIPVTYVEATSPATPPESRFPPPSSKTGRTSPTAASCWT